MADIDNHLEDLHGGAARRERDAQDLVREQQRLTELERVALELGRRAPAGDDDSAASRRVREQLAASRKRIADLRASLAATDERLAAIRERFRVEVDPRQMIAGFSAAYPILLFPVRLETRFVDGGTTGRQLLVRVYPDECLIDSFEPDLSVAEVGNLRRYWCGIWKAGGEDGLARAAWRELCAAHGAGRALYLIGRYRPLPESDPRPERTDPRVILAIAVDAPLVASERNAISDYWVATWRGDPGAWDALRAAVGDGRAEELRRDVVPFNHRESPPPGTDRATVPVSVVFVVMSSMADTATKRQTWTRPARAHLLPERFLLVADSGSEHIEQLGGVIPQPLIVGPDPLADGDAQFGREGGDLRVPPPLAWMTDFEEALRVGMAWRIELTPRQAQNGFDRLYVVGVRLGSGPERAREELETLIHHHAAGQAGFALVPQGTSTNNSEQGSSGWSRLQEADELFELSKDVGTGTTRFDPHATDPYAKRDGLILAEALGIDPAVLQHVPNADGTDQAEARAMNAALWPATLGYFMDTQMRPVFPDEVIERTRRHFIGQVSGRGVVPAIRIGKQPYGILPTTAFSQLEPGDEYLGGFKNVLADLGRFWQEFGERAPRVGRATDDPQRMLLDLLGLHASSVEFHLHLLDSADRIWNTASFDFGWLRWRSRLEASMRAQMRAGSDLLATLGYRGPDPEIIEKFFARTSGPMQRPTIDVAELSETVPLPVCTTDGKNYIAWCRDRAQRSFDELRRQVGFADGMLPNALLYHLLRHALQLGYYHEAVWLHVSAERLGRDQLSTVYREPSFVHVATAPDTSESRYQLLYAVEPAVTGRQDLSVARYIPTWIAQQGRASVLAEQLDGLAVLEGAATARLERAFAEHIDLCTYRWDAWWSSLANERLHRMRRPHEEKRRTGLYLGAFGWVERLVPDRGARSSVILEGELAEVFGSQPLTRDPGNGGHVLTPSLNHAVTAAVLRNGYLCNATPREPDLLAVDLSSARVRVALQFLDGVRNGQPLGALLGYQLERRLHDRHGHAELDFLVYQVRKAFPLVAKRISGSVDNAAESAPIETIEARNVCDGLRLLEHVRGSAIKTYPWGKNLARASRTAETILDEEVRALFEIHDAIGDLAVAESVHQTTMGNADRAAAAMDAFSKGGFPPEPEVVRTPRRGATLAHRLGLHLPASAIAAPDATPRAAAEPALDSWLRDVLPALADLVVRVRYRNATAAAVEQAAEVSVAALGLAPIDVLLLIDPDQEAAMNDLDDRLVEHVLRTNGLCPDAAVELRYAEAVAGRITVFEAAPLLAGLRTLVLAARPLRPSDAALQEEGSTAVDATATIASEPLSDARAAVASLYSDVSDRIATLAPLVAPSTPLATLVGAVDAGATEFATLQRRAGLAGLPLSSAAHALRGRRDWFALVRGKAAAVHAAWGDKLTECDQHLAAAADSTRSDEERMTSLVQAERAISTIYTSPLPGTLAAMLTAVTDRRTTFIDVRHQIGEVADSAATTVQALWTAWSATFSARERHDLATVDSRDEEARLRTLITDLHRQLVGLAEELQKRLDQADALIAAAAATTGEAQMQARADAAKALFGESFRLLPRFRLPPAQADEWRTAYAARAALLSEAELLHDFPVDDWLYGVARVRPKVHALEKIIQLTAAFARLEPEVTPLQFPHRPGEPWLAVEFPETIKPAAIGERILYSAVYADGSFDADAPAHVGLLLDEWTEVIPSTEETAGLAFHYDRPSNEAPQTLLLVTPSGRGRTWSWLELQQAIPETFALARTRAAEPRDLATTPLSRFLPATLLATTASPISIGSRLRAFDVLFAEVTDHG